MRIYINKLDYIFSSKVSEYKGKSKVYIYRLGTSWCVPIKKLSESRSLKWQLTSPCKQNDDIHKNGNWPPLHFIEDSNKNELATQKSPSKWEFTWNQRNPCKIYAGGGSNPYKIRKIYAKSMRTPWGLRTAIPGEIDVIQAQSVRPVRNRRAIRCTICQ